MAAAKTKLSRLFLVLISEAKIAGKLRIGVATDPRPFVGIRTFPGRRSFFAK